MMLFLLLMRYLTKSVEDSGVQKEGFQQKAWPDVLTV